MKVLVGCECSGAVRRAFRERGHDAWSCDLWPAADGDPHHIRGDLRARLSEEWDMLIAFPDCTYLTNAGVWALKDPDFGRYPGVGYHQRVKPGTLTGEARREARREAAAFVRLLWEAPIAKIAIENPTGLLSRSWMLPTQIIQPHQFGADASKATCLWLRGLPPLKPTKHVQPRIVDGRPRWSNQTDGGQNKLAPSDDRASSRAITYPGIALAMAEQWGNSAS